MPVRKIPTNRRSLTGVLAGRPGQRAVAFESSLERDFAVLQLFDPTVAAVEEQPVRIDYLDGGRSRRYTPDFLVTFRPGGGSTRLVEVKYRQDLDANAAQYRTPFAAAEAFAAERGWSFSVATEEEIRTPRLENARFLLAYRRRRPDHGLQARLIAALRRGGPWTVAQVLEETWSDPAEKARGLSCLWHLVATFAVAADLDQPLEMTSPIALAEASAHGV